MTDACHPQGSPNAKAHRWVSVERMERPKLWGCDPEIMAAYRAGDSTLIIAARFHCSVASIRFRLMRNGVKLRSRSAAALLHHERRIGLTPQERVLYTQFTRSHDYRAMEARQIIMAARR